MTPPAPPLPARGRFVTFEGPDGSGKSTQVARLARVLQDRGLDVVTTREPGGTPLGEAVRALLLGASGEDMLARTEALLFCAARAELVARVVAPALAAGKLVLCDRFADATVAYQGYGRGLDRDWIAVLNATVIGDLVPDLTVLLDLDVEAGLARRRGSDWNRMDAAGEAFHRRVREGYLALARSAPERWAVVPADQAPDRVAAQVLQVVCDRLAPTQALRTAAPPDAPPRPGTRPPGSGIERTRDD